MPKKLDPVERDYISAIAKAELVGDNDSALYFQIRLQEYRRMYKVENEESPDR